MGFHQVCGGVPVGVCVFGWLFCLQTSGLGYVRAFGIFVCQPHIYTHLTRYVCVDSKDREASKGRVNVSGEQVQWLRS